MAAGFGAFGKMPSAGDFLRFGLLPGFVTPWDAWLQGAMAAAQAALGAAWDGHYMSAPIWRFTLAAGLAGPQKMLGVLMPSVDRVGRRFPLTLAAPVVTPGAAPLDHFSEAALFARLEDLALAALEETVTPQDLQQRLAALPVPDLRSAAPIRFAGRTLVLTEAAPGGILPELAAGLLADRYAAPSVWSAVVNEVPRVMICDGLPDETGAAGLFHLAAPVWSEARPR